MRRKKKRFLIEIKSNRGGWKVVELLSFKPNNKILIKLETGETVLRHRKKVRYGVTKTIGFGPGEHIIKNYPLKRKRRRRKKTNRSKNTKASDR